MKRMKLNMVVVAALGIASMGATDCDYFREVTVPAADSTKPDVWGGVWRGAYVASGANGTAFGYQLDEPTDSAFMVAAGVDAGGTKKIRTRWTIEARCCSPRTRLAKCLAQPYQTANGELIETQSGEIGARVSNGVYQIHNVRPADWDHLCSSNTTMKSFSFQWTTKAWDFHRNNRTAGGGRITWND